MKKTFDKATYEHVLEARRQGKTLKEIVTETGVSRTTVKQWLAKAAEQNVEGIRIQKRYTEEERKAILAEYAENPSVTEICAKYHIKKDTLLKWKRQNAAFAAWIQTNMKTDPKKAELVALYRSGTPVQGLCEKFGVCKSTAYNWIQKLSPIKRPSSRRIITPDQFYRLEREIQTLWTENEIIHRSGILLSVPLGEKIEMIDRLESDFSVHLLCKALGVLKSTYYHRKLRSPVKKQHEIQDEIMRPLIKQVFDESAERFGRNKIRSVLQQKGYTISRERVSRLMKEMNLVCKQMRPRFIVMGSRKDKDSPDKVQRNFETEAPNLVWVSDISFVYVKKDLYSIVVIIDLYARMVVACDVTKNVRASFIIGLFDSAFEKRQHPRGLMFHSDQGVQYTSNSFRKHLRDLGVKQSFSNPGTPWDNAVAEAFFACMKREEISHKYYNSLEKLKRDVADYVDFYNNRRPHEKLGMLTPCEVERQFELKKR